MIKIYALQNTPQVQKLRKNQALTENVHPSGLKSDMFISSNKISFGSNEQNFKIGLSTRELKKRTNEKYLGTINLLDVNSPEFAQLADGDKKAVAYLTKAAYALEDVYQKQEDPSNIPFRDEMRKRAANGDKNAAIVLKLYDGQKGIIANDSNAQKVILLKGHKKPEGAGLWQVNMPNEKIKQVLSKMIDDEQFEEVKALLSQRSVVKQDGEKLKAVDYTQEYKNEFTQAADAIEEASKVSTNANFNEFLKLQAKALREINPEIDAKADIKWAELKDNPLEFTITRESYDDNITKYLLSDKTFAAKLEEKGIKAYIKDNLGVRVGIVNKKGTAELYNIKKYLNLFVENMPFKDEYKSKLNDDIKQEMADVDLIAVTGDVGKYSAGITLAENLPNEDKLSLKMGGGRKNVYHRQIRMSSNENKIKLAQNLLTPDLHKYYNPQANHWHTEIHENTHSFGPDTTNSHLGIWKDCIEEGKADMGIDVTGKLVEAGKYTEEEEKQIYTSFIEDLIRQNKRKPNLDQPHRIRAMVQLNHYIKTGAVTIENQRHGFLGLLLPKRVIHIDFEKAKKASRELLEQFVRLQIDNNFEKADKFIKENFVWTKEIESLAKVVRKYSKVLNCTVNAPLAEHLLRTIR